MCQAISWSTHHICPPVSGGQVRFLGFLMYGIAKTTLFYAEASSKKMYTVWYMFYPHGSLWMMGICPRFPSWNPPDGNPLMDTTIAVGKEHYIDYTDEGSHMCYWQKNMCTICRTFFYFSFYLFFSFWYPFLFIFFIHLFIWTKCLFCCLYVTHNCVIPKINMISFSKFAIELFWLLLKSY